MTWVVRAAVKDFAAKDIVVKGVVVKDIVVTSCWGLIWSTVRELDTAQLTRQ